MQNNRDLSQNINEMIWNILEFNKIGMKIDVDKGIEKVERTKSHILDCEE